MKFNARCGSALPEIQYSGKLSREEYRSSPDWQFCNLVRPCHLSLIYTDLHENSLSKKPVCHRQILFIHTLQTNMVVTHITSCVCNFPCCRNWVWTQPVISRHLAIDRHFNLSEPQFPHSWNRNNSYIIIAYRNDQIRCDTIS